MPTCNFPNFVFERYRFFSICFVEVHTSHPHINASLIIADLGYFYEEFRFEVFGWGA